MTSTRYYICRCALIFGYGPKNIRMGDAASEMHLLKEAEAYLGKDIWQNVEDIDALSVEYWNLRKLNKERTRVAEKLEICQKELAEAHAERANLLGAATDPFQDLIDERKKVMTRLEGLARERDVIVAKAREIRRSYDGAKTKQEVLEKEGNNSPDILEKTTTLLTLLKRDFPISKMKEKPSRRKLRLATRRLMRSMRKSSPGKKSGGRKHPMHSSISAMPIRKCPPSALRSDCSIPRCVSSIRKSAAMSVAIFPVIPILRKLPKNTGAWLK